MENLPPGSSIEAIHRRSVSRRASLGLLCAALLLGVSFRCAGLGDKLFWHDESYTNLRSAGYTAGEMIASLFDGTEKSVDAIRQYQRYNGERTLADTVTSLVSEDSEHPPLYFLLTRIWMGWFGSSPAEVRALSLLFALLAFPAIYWLSRELFEDPNAAFFALALFSLSPFHVVYAQEARQYSLWTLTIILSGAALLRALRRMTGGAWAAYALAVAAGLYTHLFFALVLASHFVFMAVLERLRPGPRSLRFLGAAAAALLAFSPWIVLVIGDFFRIHYANDWASVSADWSYMVRTWIAHFASPFVDASPTRSVDLARLMVLSLVGYSFYRLARDGPIRVSAFVLSAFAVPALGLALPDLILGGVRSATGRFLVPCHIASALAITSLLWPRVRGPRSARTHLWRATAFALLLAGAWSCLVYSRSETWWNKDENRANAEVASAINRADRPLVVVSEPYPTNVGDLLSLSHLLDAQVRLQPIMGTELPALANDREDLFLFNPSEAMLEALRRRNYTLEPHPRGALWRIVP